MIWREASYCIFGSLIFAIFSSSSSPAPSIPPSPILHSYISSPRIDYDHAGYHSPSPSPPNRFSYHHPRCGFFGCFVLSPPVILVVIGTSCREWHRRSTGSNNLAANIHRRVIAIAIVVTARHLYFILESIFIIIIVNIIVISQRKLQPYSSGTPLSRGEQQQTRRCRHHHPPPSQGTQCIVRCFI